MDYDEMTIVVCGVLVLIGIFLIYVYLPVSMAKKRGRSRLGWTLIFWFTTPLIGIIALLVAGDSQEKILAENRRMHEELIKEIRNRN